MRFLKNSFHDSCS